MSTRVICYKTEDAWVNGARELVVARLRAALATRRRATILLAGGSTPAPLYRALAGVERVDWDQVHFFWGDERIVPPDDEESNLRMVKETLLEPLGIPFDDPRVHPFPTGTTAIEDAAIYEQNMRRFFGLRPGDLPHFDVVLLGMGADGHTASLFPDTEALDERDHLAVANPVAKLSTTRLTVTFPVLNAARAVFVLVRGEEKAEIVAEVLTDEGEIYPIQRVNPSSGDLFWIVDSGASGQLPEEICDRG